MKQSIKISIIAVVAATSISITSCSKKDTTAPASVVEDTVSTYYGTVELAYKKSTNADPACFIDLSNGHVYKVSEAASHASEIDMLWGTRTATPDQKYFVSTSDTYILNAAGASDDLWKESNLFTGWSKRNVTMMDNFQAVSFDDVKTRSQFNTYTSGRSGILTYLPFDALADQQALSYYYDITHNGVKYIGVLKVTQADLAAGYAKFTLKVIKA